jgi:hypothetical protein
MSDGYLSPSRLEQERDRVIAELSEHFAHDNLDTTEFESRLDQAYRATSLAELRTLHADLPALPTDVAGPTMQTALARPEDVRARQFVVAGMGGTERKGIWTPARNLEVVAVMGGVELDFRESRFAPGVTQVNVLALMGGVDIIVPPGVRVESNGFGIMGGFASIEQPGLDDPSVPVLRVTGVAIMGGGEISERLVGESGRDAAKRRREERRRLRDDRNRDRLGPGDGG